MGLSVKKKTMCILSEMKLSNTFEQKETTVYSNLNLHTENEAWRLVRVEVSKIREYEVGYLDRQVAKCISERTELVIIPPTPDTKSSEDEIRNYVDCLWDVALYFGNVMDS